MKSILIALTLLTTNVFALDDFDLYRYGPDDKINVERESFVLKMVFYPDHERLQRSFRKVTKSKKEGEVRGFTMVAKDQDVCTVHVVLPKIWDDREALTILGHEVFHCTFAGHTKVILDKKPKEKKEVPTTKEIEDLYAEDRRLELEWLKDDYEEMGINITN